MVSGSLAYFHLVKSRNGLIGSENMGICTKIDLYGAYNYDLAHISQVAILFLLRNNFH